MELKEVARGTAGNFQVRTERSTGMKEKESTKTACCCAFLLSLATAVAADTTELTPSAFRMPTANTKFENVTFVIFDTETTGFSPAKDRIVEIGAVKIRNGEVLGERTWLLNPERYIPYYVQNVHHITPEMVKDKPTFKEVYGEFLEFIDGCVLMAHNAPFDVRFMTAEALRNDLPLPKNAVLDSLKLFKTWYPDLPAHTVTALVDFYGIETDGLQAHRATDDSIFVYKVIEQEMERRSDSPRFKELLQSAGRVLHFEE